jgi:hypothetical protein
VLRAIGVVGALPFLPLRSSITPLARVTVADHSFGACVSRCRGHGVWRVLEAQGETRRSRGRVPGRACRVGVPQGTSSHHCMCFFVVLFVVLPVTSLFDHTPLHMPCRWRRKRPVRIALPFVILIDVAAPWQGYHAGDALVGSITFVDYTGSGTGGEAKNPSPTPLRVFLPRPAAAAAPSSAPAAAPSVCIAHNSLVCHCVSLYVVVCHCVSLYVIVCRCVSLCVIVCHCVSLCVIVCRCVSLCVIVCNCVIVCQHPSPSQSS